MLVLVLMLSHEVTVCSAVFLQMVSSVLNTFSSVKVESPQALAQVSSVISQATKNKDDVDPEAQVITGTNTKYYKWLSQSKLLYGLTFS